jgi:hypothetical protein
MVRRHFDSHQPCSDNPIDQAIVLSETEVLSTFCDAGHSGTMFASVHLLAVTGMWTRGQRPGNG